MSITLIIIASLVSACLAGTLAYIVARSKAREEIVRLESQRDAVVASSEEQKVRDEKRIEEIKSDCNERLRQQIEQHAEQMKVQHDEHAEQVKNLREQYDAQVKGLREQQNEQLAAFRVQLENSAHKMLEKSQEELEKGNSQQIDAILAPLKERMAEMKKAFEANQEASQRNSASFDAQMRSMLERSMQMGEEARKLSEALRNKGKVQGDWGEQLLSSILESSGLREGFEFEMQENVKDEEGNNLRPDVIVHCSDGRNVIIDSKVSITGFYNYINATTDEERLQAERDNLNSVKAHVKELVDKNYSKLVANAVPTVLMFVPNEGSYILALQKDPQIANEAMRKGVLIINPTNLMLALMLISQLWQHERREENDRRIVEAASAMFDKFCTFAETFEKVGSQLQTAQKSYEQAKSQLNEGKGNLVKRLDSLQNMGVTSTKQIPAGMKGIE